MPDRTEIIERLRQRAADFNGGVHDYDRETIALLNEAADLLEAGESQVESVLERFLRLSMRVTQESGAKPSRQLQDQVRGEVIGFERAQSALRQLLEEETPWVDVNETR
jgi:hypothetical protein